MKGCDTMKLDSSNLLTVITSGVGTLTAVLSENRIYQIVMAVLGGIGLLLNIAYTIWKWYRTASKDGKITQDEIDQVIDDVHDIINKDGDINE